MADPDQFPDEIKGEKTPDADTEKALRSVGGDYKPNAYEQHLMDLQKESFDQQQEILKKKIKAREDILAREKALKTPELTNQQNIPQAPQQTFKNPFEAFSNPMVWIAMLGSLATRQPAIASFNSAAKALEGFHKGDEEAIKLNVQNWKDQVEQVTKQNEIELERYKQAWEKYKDDYTKLEAEFQAIAAGFSDENTLAINKYKGPAEIYDNILKRVEATNKLKNSVAEADKIIAETGLAKARTKQIEQGGPNERTLEFMYQRWANGDMQNVEGEIKRGYQGDRKINEFNAYADQRLQEEGKTIQDVLDAAQDRRAAGVGKSTTARVGAGRAANLDIILDVIDKAAPQAKEASRKVPRGKWVPLNRLLQYSNEQISDPDLIAFKMANLQLAELWARAMNPTGQMRESDREMALDKLRTQTSQEAYERAVDTLLEMINRERGGVETFRQSQPGAKPGAMTTPTTTAPAKDPFEGFTIRKVEPQSAPQSLGTEQSP